MLRSLPILGFCPAQCKCSSSLYKSPPVTYIIRSCDPGTPELSQAPSSPLTSYSRTPSPVPIPPGPSESSTTLSRFFSFLRAAFEIADEGSIPLTPTQKKIAEDRDRYLPFRQLGPSKRTVLEDPQGPFSPTRLRTREGFFDALVFRLITQASPILLQERRVHFGSPSILKEATKGKSEPDYCNPSATGQHNRFRNIPYIPTYWKHAADWSDLVTRGITLESLLAWLTGKEGSKKRFFGMGNLVGWLLASDYAYAGLVDIPDTLEVGRIIFEIDAGGRGGLALLGFDVCTPDACAKSLSNVWAAVRTQFTTAEIHEMGLDLITLEHALCKFKRLHRVIERVSDSISFPIFNMRI